MEFAYERYRKEAQSSLRERESDGSRELSHYEAAEKTRREGNCLREQMLLENTYGAVNLGLGQKKEQLLIVSGLTEDKQAEARDADVLRETGAKKKKGLRGRALTNPHDPVASAVGLRIPYAHSPEKIAEHLESLTERADSKVLEQTLPFLSVREERGKIQDLLEQRREERKEDRETSRELERLRANQRHKEQEKRKLVKALRESLEKREERAEKNRRRKWEELIRTLTEAETAAEPEENPSDAQAEEVQGEEENREKSKHDEKR